MAVDYPKGAGSKAALVPCDRFPTDLVIETVVNRLVHKMSANEAVSILLDQVPELLDEHGVTKGDYKRPGQSMHGLVKTLNKLVESDPVIWDLATAAGLKLDNPRPGGQPVADET